MRTRTHRLTLATGIVVSAFALGMVPATAGSAASSARAATAVSPGVASAKLPNVVIKVPAGQPAVYRPNAETVAPVAYTKCKAATAVLTITNKTTVTQIITLDGKDFAALPANQKDDVCTDGPSGAQGVFHLKGSTSKLTITLS